MKTVITENQRGLFFHKGKFTKVLSAGTYRTFGQNRIIPVMLDAPLSSDYCPLEGLLQNPAVAAQTVTAEVPDQHLALHFVNDKFAGALKPGKYAFWTVFDRHTFTMVSTQDPEVTSDVPRYVFEKMPSTLYTKVEVAPYQKAYLSYDKTPVRLLDVGTYYFWNGEAKIQVAYVDIRLTQLEVIGQEILTKDRVSLRMNFVCNYRITDYEKVLTEIQDYEQQLYVAAQLALRDYVGNYTFDEILEHKEQVAASVFDKLKEKAAALYVEVVDAGIKDVILPGEVRDIMNTVLVAEKRAQANVITRREEVASTRSLLNTAKMMEENATLYKLKELEYVEKICEKVGNITVGNGSDLLSQLTQIVHG